MVFSISVNTGAVSQVILKYLIDYKLTRGENAIALLKTENKQSSFNYTEFG